MDLTKDEWERVWETYGQDRCYLIIERKGTRYFVDGYLQMDGSAAVIWLSSINELWIH